MNELIKSRLGGLRKSLEKFSKQMAEFELKSDNIEKFSDMVYSQMKEVGFDKVGKDKAGNVIGVIKGYDSKQDIVMISHVDMQGSAYFKHGIAEAIYAGALIKRALIPLTGDLIVCCVPRAECNDYGIRYIFSDFLKERLPFIKGVILCEPTDFNVYLGHKGRIEYEIVVKGKLGKDFLENRGVNMLGSMFPLINELEKASHTLPTDCELGASSLKIKDVEYQGVMPVKDNKEFKIVVDRAFVPEESSSAILIKAKAIGKNVYKEGPEVEVNTALTKSRIKTYTGLEMVSEKEFKPWKMESHNLLAIDSLEALKENKFNSSIGYWKKIITEGSFTYGKLGIPTIGFGAGAEDFIATPAGKVTLNEIEKAIYGQALIIQKNIGMPTFGWSEDEI